MVFRANIVVQSSMQFVSFRSFWTDRICNQISSSNRTVAHRDKVKGSICHHRNSSKSVRIKVFRGFHLTRTYTYWFAPQNCSMWIFHLKCSTHFTMQYIEHSKWNGRKSRLNWIQAHTIRAWHWQYKVCYRARAHIHTYHFER